MCHNAEVSNSWAKALTNTAPAEGCLSDLQVAIYTPWSYTVARLPCFILLLIPEYRCYFAVLVMIC